LTCSPTDHATDEPVCSQDFRQPWQHLERLCRKRGLDDFGVRDILVEQLGRKLECECSGHIWWEGIAEGGS
jgi:hypothetical protein